MLLNSRSTCTLTFRVFLCRAITQTQLIVISVLGGVAVLSGLALSVFLIAIFSTQSSSKVNPSHHQIYEIGANSSVTPMHITSGVPIATSMPTAEDQQAQVIRISMPIRATVSPPAYDSRLPPVVYVPALATSVGIQLPSGYRPAPVLSSSPDAAMVGNV